MLIFGRAGCPLYFHAYFGAGRMPTLVSCLFSGGQDAHSTAIHPKIQQRFLVIYIDADH
ncbi:MAG: hypothetical protein F6K26_53790 [Moorea sp. SIO2I5]|nr:hypothetical protein [Moorena sp. SIO2I5]